MHTCARLSAPEREMEVAPAVSVLLTIRFAEYLWSSRVDYFAALTCSVFMNAQWQYVIECVTSPGER